MMIRWLRVLCLTVLVLMVGMTGSRADDGGFFVGIGLGEATGDTGLGDFDDGSLTSGRIDDADTGLKVFTGYRFNPIVAIEAAYIDFGEITFDGVSDGSEAINDGYAAGPVSAVVETEALFVQVIAGVPLGRFSVYGKAGGHGWWANGGFSETGGNFDLDDFDLEEYGGGLVFGVGATFRPIPKIGLRVEWERALDALVDERDLDLLSAGVYVQF
jgi:OOP family OmpA-OmpF porin